MKSSEQIAEEWGLSKITINDLCNKGKIPGAVKEGRKWQIPDDAVRPIDGRVSSGKYVKKKDCVTRSLPIGVSDYIRAQAEYYYVDKTSNVPKGLQRLIGQASSKIPFASYLFETAIDEWGREETYGNIAERAFENTVSPGYYSAENYTRVDKELRKLFEKTGDSAVLPVVQQKYYTEDYVKYDMTAEEYTKAKKLRGRKSFELVQKLMNGQILFKNQEKSYSSMTDQEKIKAIKKCYEEAGDYAKEQMIEKVKRNSK